VRAAPRKRSSIEFLIFNHFGPKARLFEDSIFSKLMPRISFATVAACIIFKDVLFPEELANEQEIHAAICDHIMSAASVL